MRGDDEAVVSVGAVVVLVFVVLDDVDVLAVVVPIVVAGVVAVVAPFAVILGPVAVTVVVADDAEEGMACQGGIHLVGGTTAAMVLRWWSNGDNNLQRKKEIRWFKECYSRMLIKSTSLKTHKTCLHDFMNSQGQLVHSFRATIVLQVCKLLVASYNRDLMNSVCKGDKGTGKQIIIVTNFPTSPRMHEEQTRTPTVLHSYHANHYFTQSRLGIMNTHHSPSILHTS